MPAGEPLPPTVDRTAVVPARIAAQLVDLLLAGTLWFVVSPALAVLVPGSSPLVFGLSLSVFLLYGGLLEGRWHGQTVGKRLVGIKVVDSGGRDPRLGQALARNVPGLVAFSWLPVVVGLAVIATNERKQRLFDGLAGTFVVATE